VKRALLYGALGLWLVVVLGAFGMVWRYKTEPGATGAAPATWPAQSKLVPATDKANLVLFAHPQCPCTRASMAELAHLAVELGGRAQIHVVLVRPKETDPGFEDGTIADRAAAIAGARVMVDDGGIEAERFGAKTSGATVLYTRSGQLAFSGGLTTARGHEGRGPAEDRIVSVVNGDAKKPFETAPTFGCELDEPRTASIQK
jgi:hypothetical protein